MNKLTPEQEKFIAVLTALFPEGIPVEKYSTIILAANLAEKGYLASDQRIEVEASDECCPPPAMPPIKQCQRCGKCFTLKYFSENENFPDGYTDVCVNCVSSKAFTLSAKDTAGITKICKVCMNLFTLDGFYKNKKSPDGHRNVCKNCKPHWKRQLFPQKDKQPTSAEIKAVRAKAKQ